MANVKQRRLRYLGFVMAMFLYTGGGQIPLAAASQDWCDSHEVCGPTEECSKPCWVDLFENTCGGYGGPPVDPVNGNCIGECGDGYCNEFNNEDAENCYDDCGECGDSNCAEGIEDMPGPLRCCQDCGECAPTGGGCSGHASCSGDDGCNSAGSCCTSIYVSDCLFCDEWEECEDAGSLGKICITSGASCLQ